MSSFILSLGIFKSRVDHKDFVKSSYPLLDSFRALGVDFDKRFVKIDPSQELGLGMRVGVWVDSTTTTQKNQLLKLIADNKLPYSLEPVTDWQEATDVLPVPVWGKVKLLIDETFSGYRYSDDPALVVFVYRLEMAIDKQNLDEFYRALKAILSKVSLPEDKFTHLKEKLFLYNVYCLEL